MKAKILIAVVALGDLAGEIVTFLGGLTNTLGWDVAKLPGECAWAVLAFPLGWLGLVAGRLFAATRSGTIFNDLLLLTGFTMNACLWGLVVHRFARRLRARAGRSGFDAAAVSARIAQVRQNHVIAAHARLKPIYARKGLVAAACQAISQCEYFLRAEPGRLEPYEETKCS